MNFGTHLLSLLFTCLLAAAFVTGCTSRVTVTPAETVEIMKSPNDNREYRYLVLENGLRVVLISDPETDKSAASLSVFRGSFDDPVQRPGLAHFLEHMLFIGTGKYPEPDGYFKFIQAHGGSANAYTAFDHTNYFFDIQPAFFREGLDRFAQFFIAPLFDPAYVEREKNAVHSEYRLQSKDDDWRGFAAQKTIFNPDHPMSRFNIGSLDTLAGDVHADLLEFFEENYSANQMGLAVLTNESLDSMEPWVTEIFAPVMNRQLEAAEREDPLFAEGTLPVTLKYRLLKADHELSFSFPVPSRLPHYRIKPTNYITNLLGHEGEGSLHQLLTEKGWITALAAGTHDVDPARSLVYISLDLTTRGADEIPRITKLLFDYLGRLEASDIEKWRYDEQATVAELGFRFAEKSRAMTAVYGLSPNLQHYPPEDLLRAPFLMEEFDEALIETFMGYLTPDRAMMTIAGPDIEADRKEKWFEVEYDIVPGPFPMEGGGSQSLALPAPNPFLPENLDLLAAREGGPQLAVNDKAIEIYLDTHVDFGVPKAVIYVSVGSDGGFIDLQDTASAVLYESLVRDKLTALTYPASLVGIHYDIAARPRGFQLSIHGYADKQLALLDEVLKALVGLDIDPARFRVLKNDYARDLRNSGKERPYEQALARLRNKVVNASWTPREQLAVLEGLTPAGLETWRDKALAATSVQGLISGNTDDAGARELERLLRKHLNLAEIEVTTEESNPVEGISTLDIAVDHNDAAILLYVQNDSTSFRARAVSELLTHLVRPGYFSTLRTEQQLGYVVAAIPVVYRDRGGIGFLVQSPVAPPSLLKQRTLAYLGTEITRIAKMEEAEFLANRQGLIARLTEKATRLAEHASRYWNDLELDVTTFDGRQQIADEVAKLTRAEILQALTGLIGKLEGEYIMVYSQGKFGAEQPVDGPS